MATFGYLLRTYRERCRDPQTGVKLTQARLAELCESVYGTYSRTDSTISNWERGEAVIDHRDRQSLLSLIAVLHRCGGLQSIQEANQLLEAGDYRQLNTDEIARLFGTDTPDSHTTVAPAAAAPPVEPARTAAPLVVPFMTPALPPQGVLGRVRDTQALLELLQLDDPAAEVPPVALRGMGGVGKTTLAIAVGRSQSIIEAFPDGVLWATLGPRSSPRPVLEQWGQALGLNILPERDEIACQHQLRAALFPRRALLLIDDVWDIRDGQMFALGGPRCRVVFTTRELPIAHALATSSRTLRVDILESAAALQLLQKLAPQAVAAEPRIAKQICERLEYLPLALTLAGQVLANEADVPSRVQRLLRELLERRDARLHLLQAQGRPGLQEDQPVSLQAILGLSVERLSKIDQDRFALLATFGGEPLSWDVQAAAHVWGCTLVEAEATTAYLIQRSLIERHAERYRMHALLADYAEEMRETGGL